MQACVLGTANDDQFNEAGFIKQLTLKQLYM